MSGGHFQYEQYKLQMIADEIEQLIIDNESEEVDRYGDKKGSFYSNETITEFKYALVVLKIAYVYAQRIDWLVSGDDGEDSFHRRLTDELEKLKNV
jgi:hypothetical protein